MDYTVKQSKGKKLESIVNYKHCVKIIQYSISIIFLAFSVLSVV